MCIYFQKIGNNKPQQETWKMAKWKGNIETAEKYYQRKQEKDM